MNSVVKLLELMNTPTALAKMSTSALYDNLNKAVDSAMKYAEEMAVDVAIKRRERDKAATDLALANEGSREEMRAKLEQCEKDLVHAIQLRDQATQGFNAYMDEQRALFQSKKLNPYRRFKEMIVPCGTMKTADGQDLQMMRIIPRSTNLEPVDMDDDDHKLSVVASVAYSDAVGLTRDQRRGKYNDGQMLINEQAANFDPGEVTPFHMACS
ncbi:MAG: hypothetical protein IIX61_07195 [Loktanella sp.]|nr:hypothetical protein [Loktanella sp.]